MKVMSMLPEGLQDSPVVAGSQVGPFTNGGFADEAELDWLVDRTSYLNLDECGVAGAQGPNSSALHAIPDLKSPEMDTAGGSSGAQVGDEFMDEVLVGFVVLFGVKLAMVQS